MSLHVSHDLGVWVAVALTLFIFSFLYKDNPLYRFVEHLFVGISAGYQIALNYWSVIDSNLVRPLQLAFQGKGSNADLTGMFAAQQGDYRGWLLIPALFGVLLLMRLLPRVGWVSRWSLAVIIGVYAGLKTTGFAQGDFVAQVQASLQPLWRAGDIGYSVNAIVFTVGLVTSLLFFFYSREHKGALGVASKLGIWFLMIGFGAGYGYTVMSRISLLIGRYQFLLFNWLGLQ